jgi:hypothetical protein
MTKKTEPWTYTVRLLKAQESRVLYGVVYAPCQKGQKCQLDSQNDFVRPDSLRKAAWDFMAKSRTVGNQHRGPAKAEVVESFVAPMDMAVDGEKITKGSWVLAVRVKDDTIWKAVQNGELNAFSIGGKGLRTPVTPS